MAINRTGSGGRQRNVSGRSSSVSRRGGGLSSSRPVGNGTGYSDRRKRSSSSPRPSGSSGSSHGYSTGRSRKSGSCLGNIVRIVLVIAVIMFLLSYFNSDHETASSYTDYDDELILNNDSSGYGNSSADSSTASYGNSVWNSGSDYWMQSSSDSGNGVLNTEVAAGSREKYTAIAGDGEDIITIMVYMCGTDLESRNSMATADLVEMTKADISDQINLLVYTGGCNNWQNKVISSQKNQIYQIKEGGLICLKEDAGTASMTDPNTLADFISWSKEKYPADRYDLIFWDHGGGSISGFGYDEKNSRSGSMDLAEINQALTKGGVKFDFIGFDACLMATMENALMLSEHGDYMIASEETEPGIGWYYTDWLSVLSEDTSMPTIEIGQNIIDDFVNTCIKKGVGQKATLSIVDLAELETTAPKALTAFSRSAGELLENNEYQVVSNARSNTKEFGQSSKIDQVDLIHLAENMGTEEGYELAEVLRSAVKYNLTSKSMTNSNGISIFFPYQKLSSVDKAVATYEEIGMDEEYARCIQTFASLEVAGQAASGGTSSPLSTLTGSGSTSSVGSELLTELLTTLLSGDYSDITGLDSSNMNFLSGRSAEELAKSVTANQFDTKYLAWTKGGDGVSRMIMPDEQWELIQNLELNIFYDDGEGFIDLGLDNVYDFDEDGNLIGEYDGTWLAINDQPVAYYFMSETQENDNYIITGRVPAMLNGQRVNLILIFDEENPYGYIAGAQVVYDDEVTETEAKGLVELQVGDTLDFLCDFYSYEGEYLDSYYLGEAMTVEEDMEISNVTITDGAVQATYRVTDIYNQHYWTPVME